MGLYWGGIEAEEAGPCQMKSRECSGFQRLKMEVVDNDSGYLFLKSLGEQQQQKGQKVERNFNYRAQRNQVILEPRKGYVYNAEEI